MEKWKGKWCWLAIGKASCPTKGCAILTLGLTGGVCSDWVRHKTHVDLLDQCVIDLHFVFISQLKHKFQVHIRWFFWAPKTYFLKWWIEEKEIIYDWKLCLLGLMEINSCCILDADKLIGRKGFLKNPSKRFDWPINLR